MTRDRANAIDNVIDRTIDIANAIARAIARAIAIARARAIAIARARAMLYFKKTLYLFHTVTPSIEATAFSVQGMISITPRIVISGTTTVNLQFSGLTVPFTAS
jgi:polysaccharide deacetylase 2 family uncharacterized protein YibQ